MIKSSPESPVIFLGGDIVALFLTFLFSLYLFNDFTFSKPELIILLGFVFVWFVIGFSSKLYDLSFSSNTNTRIAIYIKTYVGLVVLVYLFFILFPAYMPTSNVVTATVLGLPVVGIPTNYLLTRIVNNLKATGQAKKYTLVAGVGSAAGNVEKMLTASQKSGYQIKGFIKCNKDECIVDQDKVVGNLDNMQAYLYDNPVDEIIIALPVKPSKKIRKIISAADYHGIRVKYIPDFQNLFGENYKITRQGKIVAVNVRQLPLDENYAFYLKNCFDKLFATFALLLLSPLLLLIAVLIKLESPGPIFYCPLRIGKGGKPFKIFKFRSMHECDSALGGTVSTQQNDPRVTRLGRIIRKYSLDELPQFLNVILGDMSVIGPRPHRSYLNQQLQASVDKYMIRHYFKPGITGWAQVNGWRGPTETYEQKSQRTLHDIWYMENWSLWLDIKIIYMTIFSRKVHKNAF